MNEFKKTPVMLFYENKDEILDMLNKHYLKKIMWELLVSEGKYRGGYSHFCALIKTMISDKDMSNEAEKNSPKENKVKKRSPKIYLNDIS